MAHWTGRNLGIHCTGNIKRAGVQKVLWYLESWCRHVLSVVWKITISNERRNFKTADRSVSHFLTKATREKLEWNACKCSQEEETESRKRRITAQSFGSHHNHQTKRGNEFYCAVQEDIRSLGSCGRFEFQLFGFFGELYESKRFRSWVRKCLAWSPLVSWGESIVRRRVWWWSLM